MTYRSMVLDSRESNRSIWVTVIIFTELEVDHCDGQIHWLVEASATIDLLITSKQVKTAGATEKARTFRLPLQPWQHKYRCGTVSSSQSTDHGPLGCPGPFQGVHDIRAIFTVIPKHDLPFSLCRYLPWWCKNNDRWNSWPLSMDPSRGINPILVVIVVLTTIYLQGGKKPMSLSSIIDCISLPGLP